MLRCEADFLENGIIAINIREGDVVVHIAITKPGDEIRASDINVKGRNTQG
jgi:hypothetical protein